MMAGDPARADADGGLRPTARGAATLTAACAFTMLCLALHWPAFLAVGAWAGGGLLLALLLVAPPLHVDAGVGAPAAGHRRGEDVAVLVQLVNGGRRRLLLPFLVVLRDGSEATAAPLARAATADVTVVLRDAARGEHRLGPVRLVRTDPLRLFRRVATSGGDATILVGPAPIVLPGRPPDSARIPSGQTDRLFEGSVEFSGLRAYVLGDDLRRVHWPSSRRTGARLVRTFVDTARPLCTVVLDGEPAAYADAAEIEQAVDDAASVCLAALRSGWRLRLRAGGSIEARDARVVLDRLARWHTEGDAAPANHYGEGELLLVTGSRDTGPRARLGSGYARVVLHRSGGDVAAAWTGTSR